MPAESHERFFRAACVLVIDDDDGVRVALSRLLEASGYRPLLASSGLEGIAQLEAHPGEVALCICDFKMPGLDGIGTLARIHEIDPEVLRVLLTGYATLDAAIDATNRGLDAFVTKPYQSRELRTKLEALLSTRSQLLARKRLGGIPLFRGVPDSVLAQIHPALQVEQLLRGQVAQELGAPSERLCVVGEGELQIEARMPDGRLRAIAHLGPGEHFGDGSLALGEPSPLRAVASVDTELLVLHRDEFQRLKAQHPQIAQAVASALTRQLHKVIGGGSQSSAVVASEPTDALPGAVLGLAHALAAEGADVGFLELSTPGEPGSEPAPHPQLRARTDGALRRYRLAPGAHATAQEVVRMLGALRQQHRLVLVELPSAEEARAAARGQSHRLLTWHATTPARVEVDLVSLEPGDDTAPLRLRVALAPERTAPALRRLARRILGTSLGLTLGAGGARGIAHYGVLREFERAGLELDALSGCSVGACVGSTVAGGYSYAEGEQLLRVCFDEVIAKSKAFGLPVWERVWNLTHKMAHGKTFEDAAIPFMCNATDLVTGDEFIFDQGPMGPAICASMATPGVFPPFHYNGRVWSDGALVNGLPTNALVARNYDLVAAIDVYGGSDEWRSPPMPPVGWRLTASRRLPGLTHTLTNVRVIIRAIMLSTRHLVESRTMGCDLVIRPDVPGGMSSFRSAHFPTMVEIGQRTAEPAARDLLARRAALMARWRKT